jgi:cytochrome c oxidase assembly factor CtaG
MESAPSLSEVVGRWELVSPWPLLLAALLAGYGVTFRRASRRGFAHPRWRAWVFAGGVLAVATATVSPVARFGVDLLWVDFTGFLLITMVAPPLMLLGAPLTLAFRAAPRDRRATLRRLYRSRVVAIATFPVGSWLAFAVVTYLWQFTPLLEYAARDSTARFLQQASLLCVGVLFWLPAIAADPARWRLAYPLRALYVLVEMTHKGLFGGMFLSMNNAMHTEFASRAPGWAPEAMTDQRIAILILWIGGNMIFLVALIGLAIGWVAYEQRNQRRTDLRLRRQQEAARKRRAALEQVFTRGV